MIPNAVDVVEVKSNIGGDGTGQFTVDENSLAKIMGVLTNLYADPEGAVVREYLTNALDAQIEAQENDPAYVWRPIEVSLPSHFSKAYVIRDFGIGMSVDDIKDIYSKYGKSTKETSNAVTGMLGLGSKCALTYTNQFTITGYKNGMMTKAIITKNEADIPTFMIVDTRATTEPNGVEISVPVRDRNSFEAKTRHFLKFWKAGQVVVNGREPEKHAYREVKPGVFLIEAQTYSYDAPQSYVVMGNVPYHVEPEFVDEALRAAKLGYIAHVDMGAVDFPPSREKLMMTTRTKKVVADISEGLFDEIVKEKFDAIENAASHQEAYRLYCAVEGYFKHHKRYHTLQYKGESFPTNFTHDNMQLTWNYDGHGQISSRGAIYPQAINMQPLVVTGVNQDSKPTSYFKKKVKHYMNTNGINADFALLVEDDFSHVWFDSFPRIDAETIKALKLPRNGPVVPRTEAPYDFRYYDDKGVLVYDSKVDIDVPKGYTLCYTSPANIRDTYRKNGCTENQLLSWLGPKVVLVMLAKNRYEKFVRAYPNAVPASSVYQKRMNDLVDSTTDVQFVVKSLSDNVRVFLKSVNDTDVDDPDLAELVNVVKNNKDGKTNYEIAVDLAHQARRADFNVILKEKKQSSVTNVDIVKRYPLLDTYHYGRNNKHLVYYVNAVYNAEHAPKP